VNKYIDITHKSIIIINGQYFKNVMEIVGIGVDIEDISRFKRMPFGTNKHFYEKIFTKEEIECCLKKNNPSPHFAARFCAKEAFVKAIRSEIKDYKLIKVIKDDGKPYIKCGGRKHLLSLAHECDKAIAFVIVTKNSEGAGK